MYRVALVAGVGTLIALLGAGLVASLRGDGRLPPLQLDYGVYVEAALREGRADYSIAQLELAADIDLESRARVLPALAWVARREGNRDVERSALLRLVALAPGNADAHARLAELALQRSGSAGASADPLAEAERHAELALAAKPDSIAALVVSGRIALARGDTSRAFETWNRAGAVDPAAANRALNRLFRTDPELGYDFLVYRLNLEGS